MFRSLIFTLAVAVTVCGAALTAGVARQQPNQIPEYVPPEDAEMEILLYPITKFRGNRRRFTESDDDINRPIAAESIYLVRGIWLLCNQEYYFGRCVQVSGSQEAVIPPFTVRSIRLIGDSGPTFVEAPTASFGPDVPYTSASSRPTAERAEATPVVAPPVDQGGVFGNNPSLAGRDVEFFAAPAQDNARVLACAQAPGLEPNPRCVQAAADGFCEARGYLDSAWREFEIVGQRSYLVNVLCKRSEDSEGARRGFGLSIPFF